MTFTRLTLGEPRLRGKVRGGPVAGPCSEQLRDPGFENSVALSTPDEQYTNPWAYDSSSLYVISLTGVNVNSGGQHIRFTNPATSSWNFSTPLVAAEQDGSPPVNGFQAITATASPGDVFEISGWWDFVSHTNATYADARVVITWLNASGGVADAGGFFIEATTEFGAGYQEYSGEVTAPSNTSYISARFGAQVQKPIGSAGAYVVDMDDCSVCKK